MTPNPLQQAITSEKRRRGAPWTYHERDPVKMVENVKRMVALGEAIREEFPGMPEAMVEHAVKRAFGIGLRTTTCLLLDGPNSEKAVGEVVREFAEFLEFSKARPPFQPRRLINQWKGSKCTHQ